MFFHMCGVNQFCIIVFFAAVKPANNILFCIELIQRPESSLRRHKLGLTSQSICSKDDKTRFTCVHRPLMCFLSHSFVALAVCFGSLSCWKTWFYHPRPIFNALALTGHGPVHRPFDAVQLSCPLSRKTPPKHNFSTSVFDGGDNVFLGS